MTFPHAHDSIKPIYAMPDTTFRQYLDTGAAMVLDHIVAEGMFFGDQLSFPATHIDTLIAKAREAGVQCNLPLSAERLIAICCDAKQAGYTHLVFAN